MKVTVDTPALKEHRLTTSNLTTPGMFYDKGGGNIPANELGCFTVP